MWCSLAARASCPGSCAAGTFCPGPYTPWSPGTLWWPRPWASVANAAAAAANAPSAAKTRRMKTRTAGRVWRCTIIQPCHEMRIQRRLFMHHSFNILEINLYLWAIRNAILYLELTCSSLLRLWYDYDSPLLDDVLSTAVNTITITIMLENVNRSVGHIVNLLFLDMWCIFYDVQTICIDITRGGSEFIFIFFMICVRGLCFYFQLWTLKFQMFNVAFKIFVILQYLRFYNICKLKKIVFLKWSTVTFFSSSSTFMQITHAWYVRP